MIDQSPRSPRNVQAMQRLLRELSELDITLDVDETGRLLVNAPAGAVSQTLGERIREHKSALIDLLRASAAGRERDDLPRIVPDPASRLMPFPLNAVQHAYWIGRNAQMELGGVSTHFYFEAEAAGLDLGRFEAALGKVILSHDMLRATIDREGMQRVSEKVPDYRIRTLDLRGRSQIAVEEAVADVRAEMSQQVFDCTRWPLFEVRVARLDDDRALLFFSWDFLVVDAWSVLMIFNQWRAFYDAPTLAPSTTELSFRDYIRAERALGDTPLYERARRYWWERIDTLPAAPMLPVRNRIEPGRKHEFTRRRMRLGAEAWARLSATAQSYAITPSNLMLAAFAEVLDRWSKTSHYALNLTLFNRLPLHEDVMALVGDFTTLTVTEIHRDGEKDFASRAKRIQNRFLQDFEHRHFSGVEIMREIAKRRQLGGRALMPVVFTSTLMLSRKGGDGDSGLGLEAFGPMRYGITQTPQVLLDCQIFEIDGALVVNWDAVEELFLPGVLDAMFGSLERLVRRLADEPEAWRRGDLVQLPEAQLAVREADRRSLDASWLKDEALLLHGGFVRHAVARPDAIAIEGDASMTYGELHAIACDLADRLIAGGVQPNTLVAVVMEKGWQQIAAVLGILIAGGAYLPIDPALPPMRQQHLIRHGDVAWVLASTDIPGEVLDGTDAQVVRVVRPAEYRAPTEASAPRQRQSDIAYVIFTSGSSGLPKGVVIDHRGALTTIEAMNGVYGVGPSDRVLAVSSLSFDLSVYDIFGLLAVGGAIVMPSSDATKDAAQWTRLIHRHRVTLWNSAPQLMSMLVDYNELQPGDSLASIRSVWLSGDWIPTKLPARIRTLIGPCEIISLGGATEGSIWSIHHRIEGDTGHLESIPYGKALPGQSMQVLDSDLRSCPDYVIGHIHIGGPGVALGYWKDPEKTAQRFRMHPRTGERLYWTGDLGRYASDGVIEFLGREDEQIKLHGHRVELGEIAAQLKAHPHVEDAVAYIADIGGTATLVACVVPEGGEGGPLFVAPEIDAVDLATRRARLGAMANLAPDHRQRSDLIRFGAFWRDLSALSLDAMAGGLRILGIDGSVDLDAVAEAAGVLPRFRFLVAKWVETLETAGRITRDADGRPRVAGGDASEAAIAAFEAEYGTDERTSGFCRYIVACLRRQSDLLCGKASPLELLFPDGDFALGDHLYRTNPVSAHHNRQLAAAFAEIVAGAPAGAPLRVLEVGAGTGGTTASLLPLLASRETVEYWFTDLSPLFLDRARRAFDPYPFVRHALYDIDRDPELQGFVAHEFDAIVAANVLHDAKHLPTTLARLRRLLKPGGPLLLLEGTRDSPWQWLSVAYLEGVGEYTDDRAETHSPILGTDRWRHALTAAGFEGIVNFPHGAVGDEADLVLREAMPQHVIVAHGPTRFGVFDAAPLDRHLEAILPAYMIPQRYVPLDRLPLTANGKIDRAALPRFQRAASARTRTATPARAGNEQTIHAIWKEVLGLDAIGVDDNFFDLGGDSLLLTQTLGRLNRTLGLELAMADLFSYPTIRSLAEHIGRGRTDALPAPAPATAPSPVDNAIAIIGMSGRFPDAPDVDSFWRNLCDGVCSVRDWSDAELRQAGVAEDLIADPRYVKAGVPIAGLDLFDADYFGFTPREAQVMDPQLRFLLEEAVTAMESAGYPHQIHGGEIGVFVGKDVSQYLHAHLLGRPELMRSMGVMGMANLNEKDYAATQVSYRLDFTGPSLNINTACSTSLVAVHQACRSLIDGECAIALAGGVSLETLQPTGYLYREGSIASPDGRCRAFSDDANGCVRGSGIGLVVLKPLANALRDRDTVHAVILGTAINNDGARKIGFSAPSMQGQRRVIAMALARAGLSPSQIQYIETHGTGTSLGDPIEIKGLNQVFNRDAGANCLIGSLKTNIGHLDAAAGVAGLIKTVLALRDGRIPPSLHFRAPNPRIDFGDGALRVNADLREWPSTGQPRRAGVSSFGVGGTNAHAVLEQPPILPRDRAGNEGAVRVYPISAKTTASLAALAANLADWIDAHPDADADAVAYTLQVGRIAHPHRLAFACDDLAALQRALRAHPVAYRCETGFTPTSVFVFADDALPKRSVVRALYRECSAFREAYDRCAAPIRTFLEEDPVAALDRDVPLSSALAAALAFASQYALAAWWRSLGIAPEAMIGTDIGEYVAACLAGVFSLEEALSLVVVRAQLLDSTSADLPRSARIDAIRDTYADCLRETRRAAVTIPFVSSVDGAWMSDGNAADAAHWLRHLDGPAAYIEGLRRLAVEPQRRFLIVGALADVAPLATTAGIDASRLVSLSADDGEAAAAAVIARLWLAGIEIAWPALWRTPVPGRIPLPTCVFDRRSYWLSPVGVDGNTLYDAGEAGRSEAEEERRFFPRPELKAPYVAPSGEVQCALAELWQTFLAIAPIGADDNFFELGGDSLLGVQIKEKMKSDLGVDIPVGRLFLLGSIRNIANYHAVLVGDMQIGDLSDEEIEGIYRAYESA